MDIILASHGHLASGMKSAVEMIIGEAEYIQCYDLEEYVTPHAILGEIQDMEGNIIITDIFGGSVNNTLLTLMENNILVAGMNLGLVLEFCMHRNDEDLSDNINDILAESKKNICCVNEERQKYEVKGGEDFW